MYFNSFIIIQTVATSWDNGVQEGIAIGRAESEEKSAQEKAESIKSLIEMGLTDDQIAKAMRTDIEEIVNLRNK